MKYSFDFSSIPTLSNLLRGFMPYLIVICTPLSRADSIEFLYCSMISYRTHGLWIHISFLAFSKVYKKYFLCSFVSMVAPSLKSSSNFFSIASLVYLSNFVLLSKRPLESFLADSKLCVSISLSKSLVDSLSISSLESITKIFSLSLLLL